LLRLLFDPEDGGETFFRNASELYQTTRRDNPEDRIFDISFMHGLIEVIYVKISIKLAGMSSF
jgi:hypothetical protein